MKVEAQICSFAPSKRQLAGQIIKLIELVNWEEEDEFDTEWLESVLKCVAKSYSAEEHPGIIHLFSDPQLELTEVLDDINKFNMAIASQDEKKCCGLMGTLLTCGNLERYGHAAALDMLQYYQDQASTHFRPQLNATEAMWQCICQE